ncbi:GGDEF domain-containing protein [Microbacterium sp. JZ31]|uniref:GGDEF domain-containing protein n=1 Tax=Microbacterium sp. JZ31 TaxID=1906274 RepID=UPI001933F230|nr:GGDEF domain-containing protein [Microbacterium sp. JZ31]
MSRSVDHALGAAVGSIRRARGQEQGRRLPRQSSFSFATAVGALFFAVLIGAHVLVHRHTLVETSAQLAQLALCLLGGAWALAAGRRLPRWAGLVLVCGVGLGITVAQMASPDMGGFLSGLYLLPLLALYLGWAYPERTARLGIGCILLASMAAAAVNPALGGVLGPVGWSSLYAALVSVFVLEVSIALIRGLRHAMSTDPLTGALNRRGLRAEARGRRQGGHWVVVIDLDGLKPFNDRNGHAAGDMLLRESVRAWRSALDDTALIGRWGGDEFVIVVEADDAAAAQDAVLALRRASPHRFSAGIAELTPAVSLDRAFRQADRQLYSDKHRTPSRPARVFPPRTTAVLTAVRTAAGATRHRLATGVCIGAAALFLLTDLPEVIRADAGPESAVSLVDVLIGALTIAVALAMRDRFPSWAALVWVALTAATTFGHLAWMHSPVPLAEALLGLQLIAMLLGCLYAAGVARAFLLVVTVAMVTGMIAAGPRAGDDLVHVPVVVGIPASWFLLEVVLAVRLRMRRLAEVDELTGALNRLGFQDRLARMVRRAHRRGTALTVVAIDFDDFKLLNDEYGHHHGDLALRTASARWLKRLRGGDALARFGGDEFVLALPGVDLEGAGAVMRRLRLQADESWSWGAAALRTGERPDDLLLRADRALYAAKAGRATRVTDAGRGSDAGEAASGRVTQNG